MAEQTAIGYESLEWKDDASGGTPIEAAALNRMEGGIADACAGVDELRTRRLPTYVVAQDGDTATQDVYSDDILGPCLILDLATRTTYYETGGDEDGHRKALVSGADVDELRDSVSQIGAKLWEGELVHGSSVEVPGIEDSTVIGVGVSTNLSDGAVSVLVPCVRYGNVFRGMSGMPSGTDVRSVAVNTSASGNRLTNNDVKMVQMLASGSVSVTHDRMICAVYRIV